jgi:hypothetical protein
VSRKTCGRITQQGSRNKKSKSVDRIEVINSPPMQEKVEPWSAGPNNTNRGRLVRRPAGLAQTSPRLRAQCPAQSPRSRPTATPANPASHLVHRQRLESLVQPRRRACASFPVSVPRRRRNRAFYSVAGVPWRAHTKYCTYVPKSDRLRVRCGKPTVRDTAYRCRWEIRSRHGEWSLKRGCSTWGCLAPGNPGRSSMWGCRKPPRLWAYMCGNLCTVCIVCIVCTHSKYVVR